jgi:hypothetical protein
MSVRVLLDSIGRLGRVSGSGGILSRGGREACQVGPACQRGAEPASVPFQGDGVLGRGLLWRLGRIVPLRPFSLFLFFSFFFFLISILIKILCNFDSNQFKQIPILLIFNTKF